RTRLSPAVRLMSARAFDRRRSVPYHGGRQPPVAPRECLDAPLSFPTPHRGGGQGEGSMDRATLIRRLREAVGADGVFADRADLLTYEYDMGFDSHPPDLVVLPRTTAHVQAVVRLANAAGMPVVPRGAGTGLCGGAIPIKGGIVVSLVRMN